jgi:hypothetical protein
MHDPVEWRERVSRGVRLFDLLGAGPVELARDRVVEAGGGVTHLRYRVIR